MAAPPPPLMYADLWEIEDSIARLDRAAEAIRILRLRAQTVDDVTEAQFALVKVRETIAMLRAWRNRKAPPQ